MSRLIYHKDFFNRLFDRLKHTPSKRKVLRGFFCRYFHSPIFIGLGSAGKYIKTPCSCIKCGFRWVEWEINDAKYPEHE